MSVLLHPDSGKVLITPGSKVAVDPFCCCDDDPPPVSPAGCSDCPCDFSVIEADISGVVLSPEPDDPNGGNTCSLPGMLFRPPGADWFRAHQTGSVDGVYVLQITDKTDLPDTAEPDDRRCVFCSPVVPTGTVVVESETRDCVDPFSPYVNLFPEENPFTGEFSVFTQARYITLGWFPGRVKGRLYLYSWFEIPPETSSPHAGTYIIWHLTGRGDGLEFQDAYCSSDVVHEVHITDPFNATPVDDEGLPGCNEIVFRECYSGLSGFLPNWNNEANRTRFDQPFPNVLYPKTQLTISQLCS